MQRGIFRVPTTGPAKARPQLIVTNVTLITGYSDKRSIIQALQVLPFDYIRASTMYHHVIKISSNDST